MVTATLQVCPRAGQTTHPHSSLLSHSPTVELFHCVSNRKLSCCHPGSLPPGLGGWGWWAVLALTSRRQCCPMVNHTVLASDTLSFKPQVHAPHGAVGRSPHRRASLLGHGRAGGWVAGAQQREHGQAWSTTWGMGRRGVQCGFMDTWEGNHSSAFGCCGHNYSAGGMLETGRRGRKKGKRGQVCTHRHTRAHPDTHVHKHAHAAWGLVALLGRPP